MIFIEIIQYSLATFVGALVGYQMLLSLLALRGKKIQDLRASRNRKFAIVLPTHNGEQMISRSLYSLSGLVYPKNMYDLIVVADNCNDNSALIAQKLGAIVLERTDGQEFGKVHALGWAFDKILNFEVEYDAIIVFDSDSLVSGNYLEVMNYYLDQGSKVIQSSELVLPQPDVWSIEATRIGFLLYNYVKPMGRKVLGLGTGLHGNGMCFSSDILRQISWESLSLTEEVEYGLNLQLKGYDIDFAPEANVWSEMPVEARNVVSQSRRKGGRYSIIRKYAPELLTSAFNQKSLKLADTFIELITPPLVNILLFVIGMCLISTFSWSMGWVPLSFVWAWVIIAGLGGVHLGVGLFAGGADWQLFKSVFYIPKYVLWKIKGFLKAYFSRNNTKSVVQPAKERSDLISSKFEEW